MHPSAVIPLGHVHTSNRNGNYGTRTSTVTGVTVTAVATQLTGGSFGLTSFGRSYYTPYAPAPSYIPNNSTLDVAEDCNDTTTCGTVTLTFSQPVVNLSLSETDIGAFHTTGTKIITDKDAEIELPVGDTWKFRGSTTKTSNVKLFTTTRVLGLTLTAPGQKPGTTLSTKIKYTHIYGSCTVPFGCASALIVSPTPISSITLTYYDVTHDETSWVYDGNLTTFAFTAGPANAAGSSIAATATNTGFYHVSSAGKVTGYNGAPTYGTLPATGVHASDIVGIATNKCGTAGYWLIGADGGVFAYAGATFYGSLPLIDVTPVQPIIALAPTPDCGGYWLLGKDGGIFAFGDAQFYGSLPYTNIHVSNIVAFSPALTGRGYEVVGSDGGIFAFGDGTFYGSIPSVGAHASNIIGITNLTGGYYVVGSNGGVYSFGTAQFQGSLGATTLSDPIVGLIPLGGAYALVNTQGGAFFFPRA